MSREIKYRAWDKHHNTMLISESLAIFFKAISNKGQWELMQYVGLKDKNKKEIYAECHIVKFKYMQELDKVIELIGVFNYNEDELRYEIDIYNRGDEYTCLSYQSNGTMFDFEIIGNKHQDKELLNQKNK